MAIGGIADAFSDAATTTTTILFLQVLLGNRYGDSYLQDVIPTGDFELFAKIAKVMKVKHSHLLNELYEYDANAVPPVYCLKVCSSR